MAIESTTVMHGTGGDVPLEYIRGVLAEGVAALVSDPVRLHYALERHDSSMRHSSADRFQEDAKRQLATFLSSLRFTLAYPANEAKAPTVSIVVVNDSEDRSRGNAGDVAGKATELHGTAQSSTVAAWQSTPTSRAYRRTTYETLCTANLQIGLWFAKDLDPFIALRLLKQVLIRDKGRLMNAGILDIGAITITSFAPGPDWPDIPFVPTIGLTITYSYRFEDRSGPVPTHIRILAPVGVN